MKPPGKIILYVAIGCLFAIMGGMVYYASLDEPELKKGEVILLSVEVLNVNPDHAKSRFNLINLYLSLNKAKEAKKECDILFMLNRELFNTIDYCTTL